jgi:hypothetical protein
MQDDRRKASCSVLGVAPTATLVEIQRAYRDLALRYHPDRNRSWSAGRTFKDIQAAYESLTQPEQLPWTGLYHTSWSIFRTTRFFSKSAHDDFTSASEETVKLVAANVVCLVLTLVTLIAATCIVWGYSSFTASFSQQTASDNDHQRTPDAVAAFQSVAPWVLTPSVMVLVVLNVSYYATHREVARKMWWRRKRKSVATTDANGASETNSKTDWKRIDQSVRRRFVKS